MLKLFLLFTISIFLFAQNPSVYSLLGDVIYNNLDDIDKLANIESFSKEKKNILNYVERSKKLKEKGFLIDSGDLVYNKMDYLNELRELSKYNDKFVNLANAKLTDAIENNDTDSFKKLIDLDIINKENIKNRIGDFVLTHENELNSTNYYSVYKEELEKEKIENERVKKINDATLKKEKMSKIERIRDKDKKRQESLQKELEKVVEDKKKQIYKKQKDELKNY